MPVSVFPKGSDSALDLKNRFLTGELPWDTKPATARESDEEWRKIPPKSFSNGFNRIRQEAALELEEEEAKKGN